MSLALRSTAAATMLLTSAMMEPSSEGEIRSRCLARWARLIARSMELRRAMAVVKVGPNTSRAASRSLLSSGSAKAISGLPSSIRTGTKLWVSYHLAGTLKNSRGSISEKSGST